LFTDGSTYSVLRLIPEEIMIGTITKIQELKILNNYILTLIYLVITQRVKWHTFSTNLFTILSECIILEISFTKPLSSKSLKKYDFFFLMYHIGL